MQIWVYRGTRKGTLLQKGSLDPPKNLKQWDLGETAGVKLSGNCKLGFVGVLVETEQPPCGTLLVGTGVPCPFTDGL